MAAATNQQVQTFVDQRIRPRCEQIRALAHAIADDISAIDSVYAALTAQSPTWADVRADGPPNLLVPSDVLAVNSMLHDLQTAITGDAQYSVVLKACVRPL